MMVQRRCTRAKRTNVYAEGDGEKEIGMSWRVKDSTGSPDACTIGVVTFNLFPLRRRGSQLEPPGWGRGGGAMRLNVVRSNGSWGKRATGRATSEPEVIDPVPVATTTIP